MLWSAPDPIFNIISDPNPGPVFNVKSDPDFKIRSDPLFLKDWIRNRNTGLDFEFLIFNTGKLNL